MASRQRGSVLSLLVCLILTGTDCLSVPASPGVARSLRIGGPGEPGIAGGRLGKGLLDHGADANMKTAHGSTALMHASSGYRGHAVSESPTQALVAIRGSGITREARDSEIAESKQRTLRACRFLGIFALGFAVSAAAAALMFGIVDSHLDSDGVYYSDPETPEALFHITHGPWIALGALMSCGGFLTSALFCPVPYRDPVYIMLVYLTLPAGAFVAGRANAACMKDQLRDRVTMTQRNVLMARQSVWILVGSGLCSAILHAHFYLTQSTWRKTEVEDHI